MLRAWGKQEYPFMEDRSLTEYVVLGSLIAAPRHGYEIKQFLGSTLESTWRVSTSQLYALLKRLKQERLLQIAYKLNRDGHFWVKTFKRTVIEKRERLPHLFLAYLEMINQNKFYSFFHSF